MITEPAVNQAYKRVLTYIRHNSIETGDKLPSQSQMVEELGIGSNVLQSAMKRLESQGVIQRKPRVGTIVNERSSHEPIDWLVGLITPSLHSQHTPYYAVFLEMILTQLAGHGCRYRIYNFNSFPHEPVDLRTYNHQLFDDLENRKLDAVVMPALSDEWFAAFCARQKLELAIAQDFRRTSEPRTGCLVGGIIDHPSMIHQAVDLLVGNGCKHVCLVSDDGPDYLGCGQLDAFVSSIAQHQILGTEIHAGHGLILAGRKIGQTLLELPSDQRPDGLIITNDDHICLGLTDTLNSQSSYRPRITVFGCYQSPLAYSLPVYRFEYDLNDLVNATVDKLLKRLGGGGDVDMQPGNIAWSLNPTSPSAVPPQWDLSNPNPPQPGVVILRQPRLTRIGVPSNRT